MWTIRRSFDVLFKIQNRLLFRAQRSLHDQARNALVAVGGLIDLFGWASVKSLRQSVSSNFINSFIIKTLGPVELARGDGEKCNF